MGDFMQLWFVTLIIFGLLYSRVVGQYPPLVVPNKASARVQNRGLFDCPLGWNCFISYVFLGPRAAMTFDKVGVLNYWLGCCLMLIFPCCTLCYTNYATELHVKLGGEPRSCPACCLLACFCPCCLVLKDADSLDAATGYRSDLCSVTPGDPEP